MKLTTRVKEFSKKVTLMSTAFVLAVSTLAAAVPFIAAEQVSAAPATGAQIVTGDTALGYNQQGWMFNRDATSTTPIEFVASNASVGSGSLYVKPISSTSPSDKFIAENFIFTSISDINSISVDYKMGPSSHARQVYMTVYANYSTSPSDKYYDCKYNVVTTGAGSTEAYSTLTFNPNSTYTVVGAGCAATPSAMGAGAVIRAYSINFGGTSLSDAGMSAYFDNATISTLSGLTTYDFEATPDTTAPVITINGSTSAKTAYGKDSVTLAANTVRIQVAEDNYNRTVIEKKDTLGQYVERFVYDASKGQSFTIQWLDDGEYHVQAFDDAGNTSKRLTFALDRTDPLTTFVTPGAGELVGSTFVLSGEATDNVDLNRVYVQLVNRDLNQRMAGKTIQLDGTAQSWSYVIDSVAQNLPEGTYAAHVSVVDNAGNTTSQGWSSNFKLDKTLPSVYVVDAASKALVKGSDSLTLHASDTQGVKQIDANIYQDDAIVRGVSVNAATVAGATSYDKVISLDGLADGNYELRFNATDVAGNKTTPNSSHFFTVDNSAPVVTKAILNGTTISGQYQRNDNCDAINKLYPVSGTVNLTSVIEDASGATSASYSIRKLLDNGCTSTATYKSATIALQQSTKNLSNWNQPVGAMLDTKAEGLNGKYAVVLVTEDALGNKTVKYIDLNVDNTNPTVSATLSNDLIVSDNELPTVTINATDNESGIDYVQYKIVPADDKSTTVVGWVTIDNQVATTLDAAGLGNGDYIVVARAFDSAGNKKSGAEVAFTIDRTISTTVSVSNLQSSTPTLNGTALRANDDPAVGEELIVIVDGVSYPPVTTSATGTWELPLTGVAAGNHDVIVAHAGAGTIVTTNFTTTLATINNEDPTIEEEEEEVATATTTTSGAQFPFAFAQSGVLGDSDQANDDDASNTGTAEINGASDILAQAVDADNTNGEALGLSWYWWLLIVAGGAALVWWIVAMIRGRNAQA
ncbi:MAG: Ig-like domain-containing protein [Candidatus Microsaccharimonas sp.]